MKKVKTVTFLFVHNYNASTKHAKIVQTFFLNFGAYRMAEVQVTVPNSPQDGSVTVTQAKREATIFTFIFVLRR